MLNLGLGFILRILHQDLLSDFSVFGGDEVLLFFAVLAIVDAIAVLVHD
ncbi:hypothetical protein [Moraxella osloensis]|nr:hypothetical protein [Moraxella osloensis]